MDALAPQGVEISRQGGATKGFTFTGLHFCDTALMQNNTADNLHPEGAHFQERGRTPRGTTANASGQNIVQCLAIGQAFLQGRGLRLQFFVAQLLVFFFKVRAPCRKGAECALTRACCSCQKGFENIP